jgi:hypothetical protein
VQRNVEAVYATLDPVRLLSDVRQAQARLVVIADRPAADATPAAGAPTLVAVTSEVREWFDAESWRTSRELFERLQATRPGTFPDGQLRTLQRRDRSHAMVFGAIAGRPP